MILGNYQRFKESFDQKEVCLKKVILSFIQDGLQQHVIALGGSEQRDEIVEIVPEPVNEMDVLHQFLHDWKSNNQKVADEEATATARVRRCCHVISDSTDSEDNDDTLELDENHSANENTDFKDDNIQLSSEEEL